MFKKTPDRCELKDRASVWRIDTYMKRFEDKGVKFNYAEEDKELFYELHDEIGVEYKVGRVGDHQQPRRFVKCEKCGINTSSPVEVEGHFFCEVHGEQAQEFVKAMPKRLPELKVEKKEYAPVERWRDRAEKMHPKVSKMEQAILVVLNEKGLHPEAQREFCLQTTKPDFYFQDKNLAIYLDGEQAHKNREDRDSFLRETLTERFGVRVVSLTYSANAKEQQDMILNQIMEEIAK